tara:strand:+ start:1760 stop:2323 length:564 start_codon:yes stop_codon:yes gene_type:complete
MAFSAGTTRSAAYKVLATDYNNTINNVNYLGSGTPGTGRPAVMATSVLDTSLSAATWTNMLFASEEYDTGTMHDTVNTGRLTVVDAGLYQVTASVFLDKYNTAAGKMCGLMLRKNAAASPTGGTLITQSATMLSSNNVFLSAVELNTHLRLAAADYLELFVMQDSGSALVLKGSVNTHRFGALWLSA